MQDSLGCYTAELPNHQDLLCLLAGPMPDSAPKIAWPSQLWLVSKDTYKYHRACNLQTSTQQSTSDSVALALSKSQDAAQLTHRANIFCQIGLPEKGIADLEKAQQVAADDHNLWRASAAMKVGLGQFASAMSDLNQAARLQPKCLRVIIERSMIHLYRGCFQVGLLSHIQKLLKGSHSFQRPAARSGLTNSCLAQSSLLSATSPVAYFGTTIGHKELKASA